MTINGNSRGHPKWRRYVAQWSRRITWLLSANQRRLGYVTDSGVTPLDQSAAAQSNFPLLPERAKYVFVPLPSHGTTILTSRWNSHIIRLNIFAKYLDRRCLFRIGEISEIFGVKNYETIFDLTPCSGKTSASDSMSIFWHTPDVSLFFYLTRRRWYRYILGQ